MKCKRCQKEFPDTSLYCSRCGLAVLPEYMEEEDIWAYYKTDEELEQILKEEQETGIEKNILLEKEEKKYAEEAEQEKEAAALARKKRRAKLFTVFFAVVFLLICLGIGVYLGILRMREIEQMEKEYYDTVFWNEMKGFSELKKMHF